MRPAPLRLLRQEQCEHLGVERLCVFRESVEHGYTQINSFLRITQLRPAEISYRLHLAIDDTMSYAYDTTS